MDVKMLTKRFHNIFDLENCNEKIGDRDVLHKFVEKIAEAVEMKILEGPVIAQGMEQNPGLSAFAIVDFSHISVHTFIKHHEALVDIFSCKKYEREKVLQICKEFFEGTETIVRQKEVWWG